MVQVPPPPKREQKPLPDADIHNAICAYTFDMGPKVKAWEGVASVKPVVRICWEVEQLMADGRPFQISREYTLSTYKASALRAVVEKWRGRKMTEPEAATFNTDILVGKSCRLSIVHSEPDADGIIYANVDGVLAASPKAPALVVVSAEIPDWLKERKERYAAEVRAYYAAAGHSPEPEPDGPAPSADLDSIPFAPFDAPF